MKKGVTRLVFRVGNYVVKIPNFTYNHLNFLNGCYSNWSERSYYKMFKNNLEYLNKVAPSRFCTWFGLIQIQDYCRPLERNLSSLELDYFKDVRGGESKPENFGIYKNKIVCLDYP